MPANAFIGRLESIIATLKEAKIPSWTLEIRPDDTVKLRVCEAELQNPSRADLFDQWKGEL